MATGTTVTSVNSSATSVTLLAANPRRTAASIYNDSSAVLYLKLGATASTSSYSIQIAAGGYYELPATNRAISGVYAGVVDGIWASAIGAARITESIR